jgi:hypothetical protein
LIKVSLGQYFPNDITPQMPVEMFKSLQVTEVIWYWLIKRNTHPGRRIDEFGVLMDMGRHGIECGTLGNWIKLIRDGVQ